MSDYIRNYVFVMIVVAVVSTVTVGNSTSIPARGERSGGYAQRLSGRRRKTVEPNRLQTSSGVEQTQTSAVEPVMIDGGFVFMDGRYLPPPYDVRLELGAVYINGQKASQRRQGPFFRRPGTTQRSNRGPRNRGAAQIERHLQEDGLLICSRNKPLGFVSAYQAVPVLEILLGDESGDVKVQKLMQTDTPWIASEQWALLVEQFNSPAGLVERVQALKQRQRELAEDEPDDELHWIFLSSITYSGFILAVWAFGTLMSCRPPMLRSPQAVVLSKRSCRQVIWLVILLAVLNIYDLVCTVFATNVGALWELNPFAGSIINEDFSIIVFKLSLTVGAAILLLITRRRRLTQIGSWWAGVLYTVLILRWTMFNSMFL